MAAAHGAAADLAADAPGRSVLAVTASSPDPRRLERVMMGLHDELGARFFAHQQALLDRDFALAAARLEEYRSRITRHMADEEEAILPHYVAAGGDRTDAPVKLFLGEHEKLRAFLADFAARLEALQQRPDDRSLLELFDRQATYKNLMLHHDLREKNMLYPFLGERLPAGEQQAIEQALRWSGG